MVHYFSTPAWSCLNFVLKYSTVHYFSQPRKLHLVANWLCFWLRIGWPPTQHPASALCVLTAPWSIHCHMQ